MIYAIFQSGGKQYRVSVGQVIRLEKINLQIGKIYIFDKVLMAASSDLFLVGDPFLKCCDIVGEIVNHGRAAKIIIIKFRRRKHFRKCQGHRQYFTDVRINNINIQK